MQKKNLLITGSKGQVGQEINVLKNNLPTFNFHFIDVEELDITNQGRVVDFFYNTEFSYCVNCAAYTAVDKAETDKEIAHEVNVVGVKNLLKGCQINKTKLIQLSTDYVYHNSQNVPFKEDDETNPQGVYASTKLQGDEIALSGGGMVLRTSWVYSSFGHNFVKTMLRLGAERDSLGIIFDQIGTPTYARDLASAIITIIQKIENEEVSVNYFSEVYHFSNEGVCSWYDFAKAIFEVREMAVKVNPIETADYPLPGKRPPFSVLNKGKIKATFRLEIPYWRDSLKDCLGLLP